MTFGANHYVPVLKVKRGEKKALQLIPPVLRRGVTPLLEIVERNADTAPTVQRHLEGAFKDLAASVRSYSRCFLDAREIAADGPSAADEVFDRASGAGMVFTPVTGISRTADVAAALSHRTHGLAVRLTRSEFEHGQLSRSLQAFMDQHGLAPEEIDLIMDLGSVSELIVDGVTRLAGMFLAAVPDHGKWRTFTISASAFPLSMHIVARNSHDLVRRIEWIAWRDGLYARRHPLARLPAFSDCAIQHPKGVEGFDPLIMQVSASIRYTCQDDWLLIKGESTRYKRSTVQFPALATQLVYGHLGRKFCGATHCPGCASMKEAADGASNLGSAEAWRRLGTIHHLTTVARDLAALPWP